jgi:tetratricopeptide (TPR) repeat protein/tRNA A-37 threonylcarbamoyl transferase component Bud32
MTPEQWRRARALFDSAAERPPAERDGFLAEACGGDERLRRLVDSLLAADERAGSALEAPAWADTVGDERPETLLGCRLGDYEVVAVVGQGGMGVVYRAVRADDQFHKQVAVKLIRRGMDSAFVVGRFRHEREILASLDHPNVARLLDAGTAPDGRPFLVMDYVDGLPIDAYCDRGGLDVRARLELFRQVCAAVAYAHRSLVVHRDLKPGNVLITAEGVPKLLDFGIAKLLDPGRTGDSTATGMFLMTPEYASPEQVRGERITTATDVYALGILLYELLAGRRPYEVPSRLPQDLLRAVCLTEPRRPSEAAPPERRRALAGDLDNIALMALRKEPERRYASVEQLSDDVGRHLGRRPVHARPDTFWYRTSRLVRRNPLAAALAVLLLAWVGIATHQARVAREQRARAERRFEDVRRLAGSLLFEVHDAVRDVSGTTQARELMVRRALEYLGRLASEAGPDPALTFELASAYKRIGEIQYQVGTGSSLGDSAAALQSYARAATLLRPLAEGGDAKAAAALAELRFVEGGVLKGRGDLDAALSAYAEAGELNRSLSERDPAARAPRRRLVDVQRQTARTLVDRGDLGEALRRHQEAVKLAESLAGAPHAELQDRRTLSRAYRDLADALRLAGDLEGALAAIGKAEPVIREQLKSEPGSLAARQSAAVLAVRTGDILMRRGDVEGARARFQEAADIHHASARADPANGAVRDEIASASTRLCEALLLLGRVEAAGPVCREAYQITIASWRDHPTDEYAWGAAIGHSWMAKWFEAARDPAAARRHHAEALRIYEGLFRRQPIAEFEGGLAEAHRFMGDFLASQGSLAGAADHLREGARHFRALSEANPEDEDTRAALAGTAGAAARVAERLGDRQACALAAQAEGHFSRLAARHPLAAPVSRERALLAPLLARCAPAGAVSPFPAERRGL